MNGALTLGTLDGANIEIVQEAGEENAFIFGLTDAEIQKIEAEQSYSPHKYINENPQLAKVLDQLIDGTYDPDTQLFRELYDSLLFGVEGHRSDIYYVLADFDAYAAAQKKIDEAYSNKKLWAKKALINIDNSGKFSSDRTIEEYVRDIWKLKKVTI
jgi:starch phosphorylase